MDKEKEQKIIKEEAIKQEEFIREYNKLVEKYGYTVVPTLKLQLQKVEIKKEKDNGQKREVNSKDTGD